ncbi:ABC transporter substrate-binding protein [Candidatus Nomurabacteria bacterium]|nr:ABC transporter substrate-binding protein [Candidatus Nomurabacteria bacterium]
MKKRIFAALAIIALTSGCGLSSQTAKPSNGKEVVTIGYIAPQSGDSAIIGEANLEGVQIALEEVRRQLGDEVEIKFIVEDDQFDEKQTINAYAKLTTIDNADYILTVTYGGVLALADRAQNDGKILINSLDASEELAGLGDNTFAIGIYDESIGYTIAQYMNESSVEKLGVIVLKDPFTELVTGALQEKFRGETTMQSYTGTENDFRSHLLKIKDVEALAIIGWEETGRIVKQARELGMLQEIVGIDTFASEDFRVNTSNRYDGLKFAFWDGSASNKIYAELIKSYQAKYHKDPENILFTATGYDAMKVLGSVIKKCKRDTTCAAKQLSEVKDFAGATGNITIDGDNVTRSIRESMYYYDGAVIKSVK